MAISPDTFKSLLAHLAGVVSVITTCDSQGQPWGFTASSFCSLSLEPPLILCCLATSADCYAAFMEARHFAVNILSSQQSDLSQRFAIKGPAKYQGVHFEHGETGAPLLPGALVYLECSVYATYPGGDHTIIVGLVENGSEGFHPHNPHNTEQQEQPLLYYSRTYGTFSPLDRDS